MEKIKTIKIGGKNDKSIKPRIKRNRAVFGFNQIFGENQETSGDSSARSLLSTSRKLNFASSRKIEENRIIANLKSERTIIVDIKKNELEFLEKDEKKKPKPKKKSYLPENWKEEVEKKYGTVKTTTYRTNYSGDNDESFFQGKIGESEETFQFSEITTKTKDGEKKISHKFN